MKESVGTEPLDMTSDSLESLFAALNPGLSGPNPTPACGGCGRPLPAFFRRASQCMDCLAKGAEIDDLLPRKVFLSRCKRCRLYNSRDGPNCVRNSPQIHSLCLKALPEEALRQVVDSALPWSDPGASFFKMRVRLKKGDARSPRGEYTGEVIVRDRPNLCDVCREVATEVEWRAKVTVRQRAESKRTLLYLEQLVLRKQAHKKCSGVALTPDGLDFFFAKRRSAEQFIAFLAASLPCYKKESKQTVSEGRSSGREWIRYEYVLELPPVSTYDLVLLPEKLRQELGLTGEVLVCAKLRQGIELCDPVSLRSFVLSVTTWFNFDRHIRVVPFTKFKSEFVVVRTGPLLPESIERDIMFARTKVNFSCLTLRNEEDGREVQCRSHLSHILRPGDRVLGYDFSGAKLTQWAASEGGLRAMTGALPAQKKYPKGERIWCLGRLQLTQTDSWGIDRPGVGVGEHPDEFSDFCDEIEQNKFTRSKVTLHNVSSPEQPLH